MMRVRLGARLARRAVAWYNRTMQTTPDRTITDSSGNTDQRIMAAYSALDIALSELPPITRREAVSILKARDLAARAVKEGWDSEDWYYMVSWVLGFADSEMAREYPARVLTVHVALRRFEIELGLV